MKDLMIIKDGVKDVENYSQQNTNKELFVVNVICGERKNEWKK